MQNAEYKYGNYNRLIELDYGNGDKVQYEYDKQSRITKETYENNDYVAYTYDNDGNLATVYDSATQITTTYYYDLLGRALYYTKQSADGQTQIVQYAYDEKNNLTGLTESVGNSTQGYVYQYDANERLISMTVGDTTVSYTYDDFRRLAQKVTTQGDTVVKTETYTFRDWTDSNNVARTTSQIATYTVQVGNITTVYSYTYDDNGNILSINDGTHTTSYEYDSANQLVRENNQAENYTHTWEYDNAGNILCRKEYDYTTADSLEDITPTDIVNYTYGDTGPALEPGEGELPIIPWSDETATNTDAWGDLLTAYDGNTITYDGIGNPLTWGNRTFAWEKGRQLASLSDGTTTWNYTYDSNGMRTSRTNGTTTYSYTYNGSQLVQMTVGSDTLWFTYDAAGTPLTVTYNGVTYYYTTNLQGDVVGIVAADGTTVVTYSYDSWGELLEADGSLKLTLGELNPIRYRGYVYDNETALYYLQTRYYDPEVARFINADGYTSTGLGFLGNNTFIYCNNTPVAYEDSGGTRMVPARDAELGSGKINQRDAVIQPVEEELPGDSFLEEIGQDITNFDIFNQHESDVLNSNYFSFYKGKLVFRVSGMGRSGFSYGVILLGDEVKDANTVKHEYGHTKQWDQIGAARYTIFVAIPSLACYWGGVPYDEYYSYPWEYGADLFGGVNRDGYPYHDMAQEIFDVYWWMVAG